MKKASFITISLISALVSQAHLAFANDLERLNVLLNAPGFSFNEAGRPVTDWVRDGRLENGYRQFRMGVLEEHDPMVRYTSGESTISIYGRLGLSPGVVREVYQVSGVHRTDQLFATFSDGQLLSVTKCTERRCRVVSQEICDKLYERTRATSLEDLREKVNFCDRLPTLQDLTPRSQEILGSARNQMLIRQGFFSRTGALSVTALNQPSAKLIDLVDLCAAFPQPSGVRTSTRTDQTTR